MKTTPERWRRIRTLFESAIDRPTEDRDAFLDGACGDDSELRRQVGSLIVAGSGAGTVVGDAIADAAVDAAIAAQVGVPERVGRYRIFDTLGEGGMGLVLLGERADDSYHQKVAVKIIKRSLAGEDVVRRFEMERQILADLDHPAIASLLDGGTTGEGIPYLVMEYVEGRPIDVYCREEGLEIDERLRLFVEVCDAVAHAHHRLVVHRDLKPSNILVAADGSPKLLDFGIAKLLDPERAGAGLTRTGVAVLTPEYASPEQVLGEPITTASDVYSLGVLLYELVVGRSPYGDAVQTAAGILRAICDDRPEKPSDARRRLLSEAPDTVVPTGKLGSELDWILLMALRKEPERRYASVEELAQDLRSLLAERPVMAHPDSRRYRAAKFLRRHTLGVGLSAALAFVLVVFSVVTAIQSIEIRAERDIAETQRRQADETVAFLSDMFSLADPDIASGEDLTASEILERGAQRIEKDLAQQPQVQARLMNVIGSAYSGLSRYPEAEALLESSLALHREYLSDDPVQLGRCLSTLAQLRIHQVRGDEALELLEEAQSLYAERPGEASTEIADAANRLGLAYLVQVRYAECEAQWRRTLDLRRGIYAEPHEMIGQSLYNLALVLHKQDRNHEAEEYVREALAMHLAVYGEQHRRVGKDYDLAARILGAKGDYDGAESMARRAVDRLRQIYGHDNADTAAALNELANLLHDQKKYAAAEPVYREAIAMGRRIYGDGHPQLASTINNLAWLYQDQGQLERAESMFRESLTMRRRSLGEDHPAVLRARANLAVNLGRQGRYEAAESEIRAVLDRLVELHGSDHIDVIRTKFNLGRILLDAGRTAEAEPYLREAVRHYDASFGPTNVKRLGALRLLGSALLALDRYDEAEPLLLEAERLLTDGLDEADPEYEHVRADLETLYERSGRPDEARRWREKR